MHRRRRILSSLVHMGQGKGASRIKLKMSVAELKDIFYNLEQQRNRQKNNRNKNVRDKKKKTSLCTHRCVSSLLPRYLRREKQTVRKSKKSQSQTSFTWSWGERSGAIAEMKRKTLSWNALSPSEVTDTAGPGHRRVRV